MADASDGHVLGEEDKIESSESHTTQNEDDDISSRVDNPQDQVESSSLNGTGGGPATPAEEHPDAAGDDDDDEHSGQCLPGKDSSDMHGEASEEAREDDIEANTEEHEASGNLKEAEGKGTEEPSRGLAEDGASTGGELDNSRDDQEEEDEVLQIEEPSKQTRDEESEPVKQNVEDVVPQDSPVTAETSQDAEENKISTETLVEDSVGSVESEKGLQGPRTPATPLQDETNEDEKVCDNEDAPQLEAEAPELEQETPIHQLEEEAEEISSAAEKDTSSPTKMEQEDGDDTNQVEKISIDAADTSVDVEEPSREAEQEVMEVDDSSNEPTASTEKETVDDVSKDVEMEDDSQDREEEDKREQQDTSEKSPEPPVLDPENIANDQASDDKKEDDADGEKEEVSETALQNEGTIDGDKKDASSDESAKTDDQQKSEKQTESSKEEHKSNKKADEEDDDVMVIEDDKTEPEAIVLDDDDDDDANKSPEKSKDAQKTGASLATMDSSNDMGLQISSVTSGADASGLHIASVSGAGGQQDKDSGSKATSKEAPKPTQTKVKQEKVTPPSTPIPATTRKPAQTGSTPTGGSTAKKGNKMQSCIVCGKVGRCKYNIVRNGDIKHLCDDVCFRKFRANPTMFLKNTAASQQKSPAQPTTRSQTGSLKPPPPKINSQPDYKTCTVCQLMNINTQKPFVVWMNTDFCSEACLSKYQGNLNSSCSYCTSFVPPTARATHCLQVGTEFKTFCSSKCNTEFKKRLRLCAFCQKDLSTVSDSFCAPVEPNKFRDFCSKVCLKKYEEKSSDVEIIGVESTGKKSQAHKCAVCSKVVPIKHNVKLNGVLNRLCSDPCLSAFQYANKLAMNTCDNCGGLCPAEEIVSHFIQFEGQQKRFCRDACVNAFRAKHRKIVPCAWCGSKKTNFDMIERVDSNNKYQLFCSLNCLSLYRVNLQAKSNQAVTCDHCRKFVPAQYHLTMSDASVRNFCSYNCVMSFQSQFTANTKNSSQPTIHSQQRVQLQNKPSTTSRGTAAASQPQQSQSQQNSFPIISNVVSLAPQGQKQQTVNIKSSTPVPVVVSQGGKQSVSTSTQQQIIIQPPPPKQMKNKSLLCKPFVQTKATSCRPHTLHKEVQTDEHEGKPVLIPVPVPIYIPCPLAMYAYPTPQMVPIPIPIPVPIFIPTARKTADKILKHIKEIQEKIPSDPLEAELLMMAEAVAGGGGGSDSDSDKDEAEPFPPITNDKAESMEVEPVIDRGPPGGGEEDLVQMALRMAEEITGPVLDLETSVEPMAVNTEPPPARTPPEPVRVVEEEEEEYIPPRETRSRRGKRGSRGRGGRQSKRPKVEIPEPEPPSEPSPPPIAPPQPPPDANMHLKYTYGVNAWRHWVVHKNTLLEKVSKRGSGRLKLFKTDLLQCTADELNYTLCLFVKEVRKPNGEEYSPDSIHYLCLGIQQYLYENSRIDNIFTDLYYEKFTECLNDVLGKYEPKVNATGQMLCRIEEEHIWECKQLGAHSPYVLLNTLIYFNTKHFMLKTSDEHMKLSFAHILKHWKKGGPGSKVVTGQGRSVSLRYYCLNPGNGQNTPNSKKPKEGIPVYETSENLENPLRCPVKLYEFYLSKCPESIKNRNDMFYLVPERSCVPDSPVWYSTQSIGGDSMSKMLNRILLVREIQEAHIHATPIYV